MIELPTPILDAIRQDAWASIPNIPAPRTTNDWPIDYSRVLAWRARKLQLFKEQPAKLEAAKSYYKDRPIEFINHWCDTHDPRNAGRRDEQGRPLPVVLPLILFLRQDELVQFVMQCLAEEAGGLIEKSRDMGATWICCSISNWMWLFWEGSAIGWGSATALKLDQLGDPSTIFEKLRLQINGFPACFKPKGLVRDKHLLRQRLINPSNGSVISGEIGDNIGRGGRTRVYFVDEAAWLEHPEAVESALSDNTRVRIDMSSVSGLGTVFYRSRKGGKDWVKGEKLARDRVNVFVMDWSQHPGKSRDWYEQREAYFAAKGLGHVFEQEVNRNYSAAVQGIVIPRKWLDACVDAHLKVEVEEGDRWFAGLDVADSQAGDKNAIVARKGWIVKYVEQWHERDTALTTRRALQAVRNRLPCILYYDSIGVGAGVKAEANRLKDDDLMPKGLKLLSWNAGAAVCNQADHVVKGDPASPRNKDFYANLKAQGWWNLRLRVYNTFRAVKEGAEIDPDELISFDSQAIGSEMMPTLLDELGQPTASANTKMKLVVDKTPEGVLSPNVGDGCMMCCFPLPDYNALTAGAFVPPIMVSAGGTHCRACGSRKVHDLGRNRFQCTSCGVIEDRSVKGRPTETRIYGPRVVR